MDATLDKMAAAVSDLQAATATAADVASKPVGGGNQYGDSGNVQLDKFKRRLVRAVSRMRQQNKPEDLMWKELKKEIGCDCRMLWHHMRALTLKKLRRLLPANDLLENITKVARFTATDWLLFDLILVHEMVDVISVNEQDISKGVEEEPPCLYELFELVKAHGVEHLRGDELVEAWIRVTVDYNSRGRQCSPMLLQLRWYQLKELSRARFYNFWFTYRGNVKILDQAMAVKPTALQTEIVKEYKEIIVQEYPDWKTLILDRRVIVSEEFTQNREARRKREENEKETELEVIEPQVETIDLEVDSDAEERDITGDDKDSPSKENSIEGNNDMVTGTNESIGHDICNTAIIKSEPTDDVFELDGLSDVETMHIPLEKQADDTENHCKNLNSDASNLLNEASRDGRLPKIMSVVGNVIDEDMCNPEDEINKILEQKVRNLERIDVSKLAVTNTNSLKQHETESAERDSKDQMNEILRDKAKNQNQLNIEISQIKSEYNNDEKEILEKNKSCMNIHHVGDSPKIDASIRYTEPILCDSDDEMDKVLQEKVKQFMNIEATQKNIGVTVRSPVQLIPEIANELGHIKSVNEDMENKLKLNKKDAVKDDSYLTKEDKNDGFDEVNFDDNGIEFVDDGIEFEDEVHQKESEQEFESSSDTNDGNIENNEEDSKIDPKLLLYPIVYTSKLEHMEVFKFTDINIVRDQRVIDCAILESKPFLKRAQNDKCNQEVEKQNVEVCELEHKEIGDDIVETESEDTINKIKCTSWLFQKPKSRSYNPIQLCKNPDFNTRLKRLTAGFLSSTRNRLLLNKCQPLTIDVHKAFEKKLVNGEICLTGGDFKSAKDVIIENTNNHQLAVIPSAMPGQIITFASGSTNNDTVQGPIEKLDEDENNLRLSPIHKGLTSERNKTINLPDIDQVRKVNQSLLTAEVTPIRIDNNTNNTNYPKGLDKEVSVVQPTIVEPIVTASSLNSVVAPVTQVKQEPHELDFKKQKESDMLQYQSNTTTKKLIASKINDQIINISNQISQVDTSALPTIDAMKTSMLHKNHTIVKKKVGRKPSKVVETSSLSKYTPVNRDGVTWTPKYCKNYYADSLLTIDTLIKMLFLFSGDEEAQKQTAYKQKKYIRELQLDTQSEKTLNADLKCNNVSTEANNDNSSCGTESSNTITTIQEEQKIKKVTTKLCFQPIAPKVKRKTKPRPYKGIFCCWARERITVINKRQMKSSMHGCIKFECTCCCRLELLQVSTAKRSKIFSSQKSSDKMTPTIVVSDDEESTVDNNTSNEIINIIPLANLSETKMNTENVPTTISDKICINVLPSPLVEISLTANTTNINSQLQELGKEYSMDALHNLSNENKAESYASMQTSMSEDRVTATETQTYNIDTYPSTNNQLNSVENINDHSRHSKEKYATDFHIVLPKQDKTSITNSNETCKTRPRAADRYTYKKRVESKHSKLQNSSINAVKGKEHMLYLSQNQIKSKPTNPICLGQNKVLLCSLTKLQPTRITTPLPALPNGVSFVLMPNGELTLSLAAGVQLDSEQLCGLPAIMSLVQQQLLTSNIINGITVNSVTTQDDNEMIQENSVLTDIGVDQNNSEIPKTKPMEVDIAVSTENALATPQKKSQTVDFGGKSVDVADILDIHTSSDDVADNQTDVTNDKTDCVNIQQENINLSENTNVEVNCGKNANEQPLILANILTENQIDDIQLTVGVNANNPHNADNIMPSPITSDNNKLRDDVENSIPYSTIISSRKTILSDLMEMSGISAEDTTVIPDVNNYRSPTIPLPPNIIPITAPLTNADQVSDLPHSVTPPPPPPPPPDVPDNISVAGPYSNLLSFPPNSPRNHLLNYIGQIRPELNAVTSFLELKYIYENNGYFYKLDVDTGNIVPINVCIKKNLNPRASLNPKSVIDLTDDPADSDANDETLEASMEDATDNDFSYEDVTENKQGGSPNIKPIKLFKSVHSSVLKRGGKSLIRPDRIIHIRKKVCIDKQRRHRIMNKIVLKENAKETDVSNILPPNNSDHYDSSDEEPLAKKSKRMTPIDKNINEHIKENVQEHSNVSPVDQSDIAGGADASDTNDETSDLEMNSIDIEGVNPELHPVVFEEGSESDDDMCILGV